MTMRKVPVDLMMLPEALESHGENQWYLDLETGDVFPVFDDPEEEEKVESDPDRFLLIEANTYPHDDFRAMEDFVAGLPAGEARRDLERVLRRAKPFRNFREALRDWPELRERWHALEEERSQAAAQAWLAEREIEAVPRKAG
jgi:hypothetical protein